MLVEAFWPNTITAQYSTSSTSWEVIASDGTGYTSLASLASAGKTPFGVTAIGPGASLGQLRLSTVNSGAAGSPFWYQFNAGTQPSNDSAAGFNEGSGQITIESPGQILCVWVQKTTGGDTLILQGKD